MKISVKAKPNSKEESIKELGKNNFEVCVKEPPLRGLANEAIVKAVARHFGISPSAVHIVSGYASRQKVIEIK